MFGILKGQQGPKGFQLMMWDDEATARDWFNYLHTERDFERAAKEKLGPVHTAKKYLVIPLESLDWKRTGVIAIPNQKKKRKGRP